MKNKQLRIVLYINQFFAGMGGEDQAGVGPRVQDGVIGSGRALQQALGNRGDVVATVLCGDNYFAENIPEATARVVELILPHRPDAVIAGPAFNAGRYGIACVSVCQAVGEKLDIPAVTGLYHENPGLDAPGQRVHIVETANSAKGMVEATGKMVGLTVRLARKEKVGKPADEGYFPRGILRNETLDRTGADRAVSMMLDKIAGRAFESEVRLPDLNKFRVAPAPPIREMKSASIALVTDGGLVPKGNPDRIESSAATRFGAYSIKGVDHLDPEGFEVVHLGYDSRSVGEDPNRLVPLDIMRELEKEGIIGKSPDRFYSTTGVATSSANSIRIGTAIAESLKKAGVSGAILTST